MSRINLESLNFPDHFIRHSSFLGELNKMDNLINDFAFTLVGRGSGRVSIQSVNFPDRLLRHRDFRIRLEDRAAPNPQLFDVDSTFFFEKGLADPEGVSFRSVNIENHYLRHRDFHLFLEHRDSANLAPDATFFRRPAAVLIDNGPELIPADD
jgi:hypothetical protein